MNHRIPALAVWGLVWLFAASPTLARETSHESALEVVATIGMIGDLAENVGGPCVKVTSIMGPGVDPHLYRASARDVRTLQHADIILYSGYSLEGQLGAVLERFSRMKPTLAVAETAIGSDDLIKVQGAYGVDPHLWMDVGLWSRTVARLAAAIAEQRPACAEASRTRAAAYADQLAALHQWVREAIASIPAERRILVTAHDAFNYYGRAYGIEVAGIQGISTESEAGIADIRHMAGIIAERRVPAVFIESTINPRTIQAVIEAAADQGQAVRIGGQLYSDAMGETGTAGGTYIGMIYENTAKIVDALGGRPPPLPPALRAWAERWEIADEQAES
ncbi:ABC-type metal ion transport system, periplasmic component/surface adhesin [Thioflavicoccus mobilis 8321]|uniref:ABC-type metal ion transport system, periplasmic component/surface adhesin n=1 Tax=Thioflavicoccus mobilis 8321 TaxID=765912 RepID=L0GW48_9GAMM|nr:zinc ABC transporter substrate-binding protein [Thioflavicoccus mobilis]AGA90052.1 ABC-type metal ion transport system, periplasmic component/surface adhesin [Thioflavicoccus mobilis 8321]